MVLPNTPSVLSIGRRVVEKGYDFVWRHGEVPYLIHPDDQSRMMLAVQDFCPYLEITGCDSPPPPPLRRRSNPKASAAATHAGKDYVLNINAKEFYPIGHVRPVNTEGKRRRGRGTRWVERKGFSDKIATAPATIKDDGDAEAEVAGCDDEARPGS